MTSATLKKAVNQLGALRVRAGELAAAEKVLTKRIRKGMEEANLDQVATKGFVAQLADRDVLKLDPAKFRRRAGPKVFLACVRIDLKAARAHFPDEKLEKYGKVDTTTVLRISKRS